MGERTDLQTCRKERDKVYLWELADRRSPVVIRSTIICQRQNLTSLKVNKKKIVLGKDYIVQSKRQPDNVIRYKHILIQCYVFVDNVQRPP